MNVGRLFAALALQLDLHRTPFRGLHHKRVAYCRCQLLFTDEEFDFWDAWRYRIRNE